MKIDPTDPSTALFLGEPVRQALLEAQAANVPLGGWTVVGCASAAEALSDEEIPDDD